MHEFDAMQREWYWRNLLLDGRTPDWAALVALFVVAAFYFAPALAGSTLSLRGRFCFLTAMGILLISLSLGFVRVASVQYEGLMYLLEDRSPTRPGDLRPPIRFPDDERLVRPAQPTSKPSAVSIVVQVFLPALQAGAFVLALFFFILGLPAQVRRKQPLEA